MRFLFAFVFGPGVFIALLFAAYVAGQFHGAQHNCVPAAPAYYRVGK